MNKWIIKDWTGRVLFDGKTFETFEDGWGFIYENDPLPEESHPDYFSWYDDYFVEEMGEK